MRSQVQTEVLTHIMLYDLFREAGAEPFRIKGGEPFLFSQDMAKIQVHLRVRGELMKVGKIGLDGHDKVLVESVPEMGQTGHHRLEMIVPAIAKTLATAHRVQKQRRHDLVEDALAIMGPRDQNKKIAVLRTTPHDGMNLAAFSNYFSQALPAGMSVKTIDVKPLNTFTATIQLKGGKGNEVAAFTLRHMGNRLETECLVDAKARVEFVDGLFDAMRARRDRVLSDPDLDPALQALIEKAGDQGPLMLEASARRDPMAKAFGFHAHTSGLYGISRSRAYTEYRESEGPEILDLGHEVTAILLTKDRKPAMIGIAFKGEPIATSDGFLKGIKRPDVVFGAVKALVVRARPDLFSEDAKRLDILNEDQNLLRAIETPEDITDTPLLNL